MNFYEECTIRELDEIVTSVGLPNLLKCLAALCLRHGETAAKENDTEGARHWNAVYAQVQKIEAYTHDACSF